jgi:E-phenylitaconyl-CoA hydratase
MGLIYEVRNHIAYFIIDNSKMNVITPQIHKDFYHSLKQFEIGKEARIGILMGAGDRSFSAGDDIKNVYRPKRTRQEELDALLFLHQDDGDTPTRPGWEQDVYMHRRYKPFIAAVNGYCIGSGMIYLLLHSDIRVAGQGAKFGIPELNFGAAGVSGTTRLARHIPYTAAAWLVIAGEFIDAEEARRVNLINRVVPDADVLARAEAIAEKIIHHPPSALRVEMETMQVRMDMSRVDAVYRGQNLYRLRRLNYEGYGSTENFFADRQR